MSGKFTDFQISIYYVSSLFPQNSHLNFMNLESKIIKVGAFVVEKQFNKDASKKKHIDGRILDY